MNYNLLYSITNIFCESAIYLVPYINNTEFSCSLYSGNITNITVENYFELMQMLSYYNLDYSFVGNNKVEGNTSIILRNGNLILPSDSYVTPSYVFCDIPKEKEFKNTGLKADVIGREFKGVLDSCAKDLLRKLLCASTEGVEEKDIQILYETSETSVVNTKEEEEKESTNKKDEESKSQPNEAIKNKEKAFTNPFVENSID